MNNRIVAQPRGRVLGGSSAINFMMLSHASKADINAWEELGNSGWNFEAMLRHTMRRKLNWAKLWGARSLIRPFMEQMALFR